MNTKIFKGVGAAVSLFVGLGAASPVLAESSTGAQALRAPANSVDVWIFSCPRAVGPGGGAQARVFDLIPPNNAAARMQVVLSQDGSPTREVTDLSPRPTGEGDGSSPFARVFDGPGRYVMVFKKTAAGVERYEGRATCINAAGGFVSNPRLPDEPIIDQIIDPGTQ